jgi:hypothetical protein
MSHKKDFGSSNLRAPKRDVAGLYMMDTEHSRRTRILPVG